MKVRGVGAFSYIVVFCGLAFFIFSLSHNFVTVDGTSMQPTIMDGDTILSSKIVNVVPGRVYLIVEPTEGYYAVKRLIGVPGDCIEFKDGAIYRNGELFDKPHGDSFDTFTVTLGADEYYFVGDNRKDSYDSRYWSRRIKLSEIIGEVTYILEPSTRRGKVEALG